MIWDMVAYLQGLDGGSITCSDEDPIAQTATELCIVFQQQSHLGEEGWMFHCTKVTRRIQLQHPGESLLECANCNRARSS